MDLELRHLRYFSVLADEMHFGRAAERLHIAQPSLSQQIRKLEGILEVELFDRSGRNISLTPAGTALSEHAARTFEVVEVAVTAAVDADRGVTGRLVVGFVETAAISLVPAAVRQFRITNPRVDLELRELSVPAQIEQLIHGTLDLGFIRTEPGHDELVVERRIGEHLVVALPADHQLSEQPGLDPRQVASEPLIVIDRRLLPGLHDETVTLIRDSGGSMNVAQQTTSILSTLGLVSAGLGIAILPAVTEGLAFEGINYVPLRPSPRTEILAVRHLRNDSPQITPFLEAIAADI